jgi:hypothetical protein
VIRVIGQFLKENNLHGTLQALQDETQVGVNLTGNIDQFKDNVLKGNWDAVLTEIKKERLCFPKYKLQALYELVKNEKFCCLFLNPSFEWLDCCGIIAFGRYRNGSNFG